MKLMIAHNVCLILLCVIIFGVNQQAVLAQTANDGLDLLSKQVMQQDDESANLNLQATANILSSSAGTQVGDSNYQFQCYSDYSRVSEQGTRVTAKGYSSCFIDKVMRQGDVITVRVNKPGNFICLGLLDASLSRSQRENPNQSYYTYGASACTDESFYNGIIKNQLNTQGCFGNNGAEQDQIIMKFSNNMLVIQSSRYTAWAQFFLQPDREYIPFFDLYGTPQKPAQIGSLTVYGMETRTIMKDPKWRFVSQNQFAVIEDGFTLGSVQGQANGYIDQELRNEDQWEIVITKFVKEGWICFGVIDSTMVLALRADGSNSLFTTGATACTGGLTFNGLSQGAIKQSGAIPARRAVTIHLQFKGNNRLFMSTPEKDFYCEFQLQSNRKYVPYVELSAGNKVELFSVLSQQDLISVLIPQNDKWIIDAFKSKAALLDKTSMIISSAQGISNAFVDTILSPKDEWEVTILKNAVSSNAFCLGVVETSIIAAINQNPQQDFSEKGASLCSDNKFKSYIPGSITSSGSVPLQAGKSIIFQYTGQQLVATASDGSFYSYWDLNGDRSYVPYFAVTNEATIYLNAVKSEFQVKPISKYYPWKLQSSSGSSVKILNDEIIENQGGNPALAFIDNTLKPGEEWTLTILKHNVGYICFGIIDAKVLPIIKKSQSDSLRQRSVSICSDQSAYSGAFKGDANIQGQLHGFVGQLVTLKHQEGELHVFTHNRKLHASFQLDSSRTYIPFFELTHGQSFALTEVHSETEVERSVKNPTIPWKWQSGLPNTRIGVSGSELAASDSITFAFVDITLQENDSWEVIIGEQAGKTSAGMLCLGMIETVFAPTLMLESHAINQKFSVSYCMEPNNELNNYDNTETYGQINSGAVGTIIKLAYKNDQLQIYTVDRSFMATLWVNPQKQFCPFAVIQHGKKISLVDVKAPGEVIPAINFRVKWNLLSPVSDALFKDTYLRTESVDVTGYVDGVVLSPGNSWDVIVTNNEKAQVCFGVIDGSYIESLKKNKRPDAWAITKNLMVGICPTNGKALSPYNNSVESWGEKDVRSGIPYKITYTGTQLRVAAGAWCSWQHHFELPEQRTFVPYFSIFNGPAAVQITGIIAKQSNVAAVAGQGQSTTNANNKLALTEIQETMPQQQQYQPMNLIQIEREDKGTDTHKQLQQDQKNESDDVNKEDEASDNLSPGNNKQLRRGTNLLRKQPIINKLSNKKLETNDQSYDEESTQQSITSSNDAGLINE